MSSRSNMIISLIIIGIIFGGVGTMILVANPYEPSKIAVVVMSPGFGDMSFADNVLEGMNELAGDISVQYYIPDELPTTVTEAQQELESLATLGIYDIILAIGAEMAPAVQTVATLHPTQKFGIIGADIPLDNVASSVFASEQSGFLGGVVAAFLASEQPYYGSEVGFEGEIGILAAQEDDPELLPMINGFIQGVQAANATYNLSVTITDINYIGSWNNTAQAQIITELMFGSGISLIFTPVRASMPGVRAGMIAAEAAFSPLEIGRMPLVIAAEGDQDYFGTVDPDIPIAPSWIATSTLARTDLAFYDIVNKTMWNEFPGNELLEYNLMNGGVNITEFQYSSTYMTEEMIAALVFYRDWIVNNPSLVIP